jgi:hypothetical protein
MGVIHDRSCRQANVAAALAAAQNPGPVGEAERLSSSFLAMGTGEPIVPPSLLQVGGARGVVGKQPLELGKLSRKRQVIVLQNVHAHPVKSPAKPP